MYTEEVTQIHHSGLSNNMGQQRRHYTESEKKRILAEIRNRVHNGDSLYAVVEELGIPVQNYYRWVKQFDVEEIEIAKPPMITTNFDKFVQGVVDWESIAMQLMQENRMLKAQLAAYQTKKKSK